MIADNKEESSVYIDDDGEIRFTIYLEIAKGKEKPSELGKSYRIPKPKLKSRTFKFATVNVHISEEQIPKVNIDTSTKIVKSDGTEKIIKFKECPSFKLPPQLSSMQHTPSKINIVLDIDLTLVQACSLEGMFRTKLENDKRVKWMAYKDIELAVVVRPGLTEFLESISQFANIFAYTHGERIYATTLLDDFIDPDKKFINREVFFAIDGNLTKNAIHCKEKDLNILFKEAYDVDRSVIFDDQPNVWKYDRSKVLQSMQFAPLHYCVRGFKGAVNLESLFTCSKSDSFESNNAPYIETFSSEYSQLKYIANFLKICYIEYTLNQEEYFSRTVLRKRKQILKGYSISIEYFYENCDNKSKPNANTYVDLAKYMGAEVIKDAYYFVFAEKNQSKMLLLPEGSVAVHAYFVLSCFMNCTKMPEEPFLILRS